MTTPAGLPIAGIGLAFVMAIFKWRRTAKWNRATAEVLHMGPVNLLASDDGAATPVSNRFIRYVGVNNSPVVTEDKRMRLTRVCPGEQVDILYSPGNPDEFVAANLWDRFRVEIVISLAALAFFFLISFSKL